MNEILNINFIEILPGETKYIDDTTIEAVKSRTQRTRSSGIYTNNRQSKMCFYRRH